MTDPEQIIAEKLHAVAAQKHNAHLFPDGPGTPDDWRDEAEMYVAALRSAGTPVGWRDVRERLLTDEAVDAASWVETFQHGRCGSEMARAALAAALDHAEQEGKP